MPIEPDPTPWEFPDPAEASDDLVAIGADLEAGTVLAAYRRGLFPMPLDGAEGRVLGWWSPDPRGVIPLDRLRVTRSVRQSMRKFDVRVDTAFEEVIDACADAGRPQGWISPEIREAYVQLHHLGWAHSVEAWTADGELGGGLYGVSIDGLFAGESMFHRERDASKVALVGLVDRLRRGGAELLDVQWVTPHLQTLGAVPISRREYLRRLARALSPARISPFT